MNAPLTNPGVESPPAATPTAKLTATPSELLELARQQGAAAREAGAASEAKSDRDAEFFHKLFVPAPFSWKNTDKVVFFWMLGMHAGALAAPFFFSWTGLIIAVVMHWFTCSIGICLGYHRYLSHKSLKLKPPAEFVTLLAGALAGEGSPLQWGSTHRLHHQRSDLEGDPHSPTDGPWWSHFLWFMPKFSAEDREAMFQRYVPEIANRPLVRFFEKTYFMWLVLSGVALFGVGYAVGGWTFGLSLFLWGLCMRAVVSYHSTWFVNSATHIWGYRNYDTRDHSRNLWWVAILSYGEGWHNNHHAHPSVAPAGHRWWELDPTYWSIRFLKLIGQAHDVKDKLPEGRDAAANPEPNSYHGEIETGEAETAAVA